MFCPSCRGRLSYSFSWTVWNPFHFRCPHCGAALKITNFVRALRFPCALGLVIAAAAIALEETGALPEGRSLLYIVIVSAAVGLLWHSYAWSRGKFTLAQKA